MIKAWTPFTLNSGKKITYGYGFYSDRKFNKTSIFHNGFIFGYSTSDMYFPEDDLLILVVSNISDINVINTNSIIFDIASSIYKSEIPDLNTGLLDAYVGTYQIDKGFKVKIFRKGLVLFIEFDGQPAAELATETQTKFRVKDFPAKVEFIKSSENGKMKILLSNGPEKYQGTKE